MNRDGSISIGGVKYLKEDSIKALDAPSVIVKECDAIAKAMVGRFVLPRSGTEKATMGTVSVKATMKAAVTATVQVKVTEVVMAQAVAKVAGTVSTNVPVD